MNWIDGQYRAFYLAVCTNDLNEASRLAASFAQSLTPTQAQALMTLAVGYPSHKLLDILEKTSIPAISDKNHEVIIVAIKSMADISFINRLAGYGFSWLAEDDPQLALRIAIQYGRYDLIKLALEAGAPPFVKGLQQTNPFCEFISNHLSGNTREQNVDILGLMLAYGAQPYEGQYGDDFVGKRHFRHIPGLAEYIPDAERKAVAIRNTLGIDPRDSVSAKIRVRL